jgi:hypothetical protein
MSGQVQAIENLLRDVINHQDELITASERPPDPNDSYRKKKECASEQPPDPGPTFDGPPPPPKLVPNIALITEVLEKMTPTELSTLFMGLTISGVLEQPTNSENTFEINLNRETGGYE